MNDITDIKFKTKGLKEPQRLLYGDNNTHRGCWFLLSQLHFHCGRRSHSPDPGGLPGSVYCPAALLSLLQGYRRRRSFISLCLTLLDLLSSSTSLHFLDHFEVLSYYWHHKFSITATFVKRKSAKFVSTHWASPCSLWAARPEPALWPQKPLASPAALCFSAADELPSHKLQRTQWPVVNLRTARHPGHCTGYRQGGKIVTVKNNFKHQVWLLNWYFVFNLHHTLQNGAIIVYLGSSHLWRFRVQWQRLMSAGSPFPLFIIALALGLGQAKLSFPGIPQFRVFLLLFFFYGHIQLIFILVFTIQCILLITLFTGTLQPSIQMTLYFFILYLQAEQSFPVTEGGYNK